MNISLQNVDKVSAVLTVQIEKAGFPSGNGAHEFGEETIRYICIGRRS